MRIFGSVIKIATTLGGKKSGERTLTESADGLKMSTPTGQSYDARFDGKEVLTAGSRRQMLRDLPRGELDKPSLK